MSRQHKDIKDPNIHNPKDFTAAALDTVCSKDSFGNLVWVTKNNVGGSQGLQGVQGPVAVTQNLIEVQKSPQTGQFLTIESALLSIVGASALNPYVIKVGPGVYIENQLVMIPFVTIVGFSETATCVRPSNPNIPLFIGAKDTMISNIQILDVTGAEAVSVDIGIGTFYLKEVILLNNKIHVKLAPTLGTRTKIDLFRVLMKGFSDFCIHATSNVTQKTKLVMHECNLETSNPLGVGIFGSGSNTEIILNGGEVDGELIGDKGVVLEDGVSIESYGTEIEAWTSGLIINNIGTGPTLILNSILFEKNITDDAKILHPAATGLLDGSMQSSKTTSLANGVSITHSDHIAGNFVIAGDLMVGKKHSEIVEVSDLITQTSTMGIVSGGVLSYLGVLDFQITGGFGYIEDSVTGITKKLSWLTQTITVPLSQTSYLIMDATQNITISLTLPTTINYLVFGKAVTDTAGVIFFEDISFYSHHAMNKADAMMRDAFGPVYNSGSIVTENVTPRNLDVTAGVYYLAAKKITPIQVTAVTFNEFHQNGVGGYVNSLNQTVNNTVWDNNSNLTALTANYFSKHSLYLVGNVYMLVLSQAEYATQILAEGANIPTPPTYFDDSVVLISTLIMKQGVNNIVKIIDERPVIGFKASGVSASSNHNNLSGLGDPNAHTQYLNRDGSKVMTGTLDMGGNAITNAIVVGTSTAPPIAQVPDQANAEGVSIHKARADHVHNIATAISSSVNNLNVKGVATSFSRSDHKHKVVFNQIVGNELTNQLAHNITNSVGVISGFNFIDNLDGTLQVVGGSVFIKSANLSTGDILLFNSVGAVSLILTNLVKNYIYIQYNAGVPTIISSLATLLDTRTNILLGSVYKNLLDLHIDETSKDVIIDHTALELERMKKTTTTNVIKEINGGSLLGTNILLPNSISITAGTYWYGLNKFITPLFDSSGIQTFDTYLKGLPPVGIAPQLWTKSLLPVSAVDILSYRDPLTATLLPLTAPPAPVVPAPVWPPVPPIIAPAIPYYSPRWIYQETNGRVSMIYGGGYETVGSAENEQIPSVLPPELTDAMLIGQVIVSTTAILPAVTVFKIRQRNELNDGIYLEPFQQVVYNGAPLIPTVIPQLTLTPAKGTYDVVFNVRTNSDTGRVFIDFEFNISTALAPLILTPVPNTHIGVATQRSGYTAFGQVTKRMTFSGTETLKITGFYNDIAGRGPGIEWTEFMSVSMKKL